MMATISDRNQVRRFQAFYKEYGIDMLLVTLGQGTAASEVLDSFGLEAVEKALLFAFVLGEEWERIKNGLQRQMHGDRIYRSREHHRREKTASISHGRAWV